MSKIVKSPIILQKEAELKVVEKKIKKINTQIKRNRTMLKNFKQAIVDMQRTVSTDILLKTQELEILQKEVVELIKKSKITDQFFGQEKEAFEEFTEAIQEQDFINEEQKEQIKEAKKAREQNDERQRADPFVEFWVKPKEKEQRNIRKTYLKLASKFHPDKATSKKETERFNILMQEIVNAYEKGDIQKLLDLEKQYSDYESPEEIEDGTGMVDAIQSKIERLKNQLTLLTDQNNRLKTELKEIKKSDIGEMVQSEKRRNRYHNPFGDMFGPPSVAQAAESIAEMYDTFFALKKGLHHYMQTGDISEELEQYLSEIVEPVPQNPLETLFDMFDDDEEDEEDELDFDRMKPEEALSELFNMMGMMMEEQKKQQRKKAAAKPKKKTRRRRKK